MNPRHLVAGEIVHHDDVAGFQNRCQMLLEPGAEQRAVERSFNRERSEESLGSQSTKKRCGLPAAARSLFHQTRAQWRATVGACHVRFGPRFVDEDDFGGIDLLLRGTPLCSLLGDVGTVLLAGNLSLFFRDCSSTLQALQMVIRHTSSPSSCFNSACNSRRYMSGRAVSFATNQSAQACHFGWRGAAVLGATWPVSRRCC